MKKYRLYQVNVFTNEKFRGNPAGVVADAGGLTDLQMQLLARELNNPETAFLLPAGDKINDLRVRYFTPLVEVPVCGHATIAANYIYAKERNFRTKTIKLETKAGNITVELKRSKGKLRLYMTHPFIKIQEPLAEKDCQLILKALKISQQDLAPNLPVQIVSTGHSKVIIPIRSRITLNKIEPDFALLKKISEKIKCNACFLFVIDNSEKGILTHCRMFAPAIGINEDPVTGNGNGPLGVYLVNHHLIKHNGKRVRFKSRQGEAMGRPGVAEVIVVMKNGVPVTVKVGGMVTEVFETAIEI